MDEYFISYYGCESKTKKDTGRRCTKCLNICEQKTLLCRCRIWDLTDEEVDQFKEAVAESGGFAPVITHAYNIKNVIGSYVLHGTKDIPVKTYREKQEHVQARENSMRDRVFHEFDDMAQSVVRFQQIAENIRKLRYRGVPAPSFTDNKTIAMFYQFEVAILKKVANEKMQAIRREKKKLERKKKELEKEIAKLETEETNSKATFNSWIKSEKQELEAIQKNCTVGLADGVADSTPAGTDIDVADMIDETKGRWVLQSEFLDHNINATFVTDRDLQRDRHNGNVVWSIKNHAIGKDKAGRILEKTSGKTPHKNSYRYFLLQEHDKTIQLPQKHGN